MSRTTGRDEVATREQWDERSVTAGVAAGRDTVPAPTDLVAEEGVGHVTLRWATVDGAIGYEVLRGDDPGSLVVLDHLADDLLAVGGRTTSMADFYYVAAPGRVY